MNVILKKIFPLFLFLTVSSASIYGDSHEETNRTDISPKDLTELATGIFLACALVEEGKVFYSKKDYLNAQKKFEEALRKDPENKEAREYLSLCGPKALEQKKDYRPETKLARREKIENEIRLLKELETRIFRIETEQKEKISKPFEKLFEKKTEVKSELPKAKEDLQPLLSPEQETQRIEKAEELMKEGNKYYKEMDFEQAYKIYKQAFAVLNTTSQEK
ncbi:MAG: hypothetical protein ABH869_02205 [Candidatus Omnitrophota bacterium]